MLDAAIIGGGIAGLTAGFKLRQAGLDIAVIEAADYAGGNIRTINHEGFRLEIGPYSFLGSSEYIWKLVGELEFDYKAEPSSALADNRYIFRDGKLHALPSSLSSFFGTRLLSGRAKLRLMAEPFIPGGARTEDTAWDFFVRRFGKEAATYIMGPFVSGIYAGDVKLLGAKAAFEKFWNFERESGSMILGAIKYMREKKKRMRRENIESHKGLYSFKGGLGSITEELAARLGDSLVTSNSVLNIRKNGDSYFVESSNGEWHARTVICAVPPHIASGILKNIAPDAVKPISTIPMSPVTLIHWSQPADLKGLPSGFGFLMPRLYDLRVLGTIFSSQLFNGRAPDGKLLYTSYYGGMTDKPAMELTDAQILELLIREHSRIFGVKLSQPEMHKIIRYPAAIPQLTPEHPAKVHEIKEAIKSAPGVFLAGNYLTGVGMEHAVTSGYEAASQALNHLTQSRAVTTEAPAV